MMPPKQTPPRFVGKPSEQALPRFAERSPDRAQTHRLCPGRRRPRTSELLAKTTVHALAVEQTTVGRRLKLPREVDVERRHAPLAVGLAHCFNLIEPERKAVEGVVGLIRIPRLKRRMDQRPLARRKQNLLRANKMRRRAQRRQQLPIELRNARGPSKQACRGCTFPHLP